MSSTSHMMMPHHSTDHLRLVSRALTKRPSLHGEEYLAAEKTVVEEHRAEQGPHARSGLCRSNSCETKEMKKPSQEEG